MRTLHNVAAHVKLLPRRASGDPTREGRSGFSEAALSGLICGRAKLHRLIGRQFTTYMRVLAH